MFFFFHIPVLINEVMAMKALITSYTHKITVSMTFESQTCQNENLLNVGNMSKNKYL